jgi:hypothetical protein
MVIHMKTTVEIPDGLLREVKRAARERKTTVRSLIIDGLRALLAQRPGEQRFVLRDASFKGKGLQPHVADGSWDKLRDLSYEGRGS